MLIQLRFDYNISETILNSGVKYFFKMVRFQHVISVLLKIKVVVGAATAAAAAAGAVSTLGTLLDEKRCCVIFSIVLIMEILSNRNTIIATRMLF